MLLGNLSGEGKKTGMKENKTTHGWRDTAVGNRTKRNRGAVEAAGSVGSRARDDSWRECPREGEMGALRRKRPRRRQKRGKQESAEREEVREQGSTAPRGQRRRCRRKTAPGEQ